MATGHHQTFASQLTPKVEQVLHGIKRTDASRPQRVRLPITIQLMRQFKTILLQQHHHENILLWAACCIAFFGFLRCSEFTVPSTHDYDPAVHLSPEDLTIDSRDSPSVLQVHIKQSKTDPFCKGVRLVLGKKDTDVCPLKAILPYMVIRGNTPGPFFLMADRQPLTRQVFHNHLSNLLRQLGLPSLTIILIAFELGQQPQPRRLEFLIPIFRCWDDGIALLISNASGLRLPH